MATKTSTSFVTCCLNHAQTEKIDGYADKTLHIVSVLKWSGTTWYPRTYHEKVQLKRWGGVGVGGVRMGWCGIERRRRRGGQGISSGSKGARGGGRRGIQEGRGEPEATSKGRK